MAHLKNPEPILWTLFGAGGMVAAFILPAIVIVLGILVPLGVVPAEAVSFDRIHGLVTNPITRLALTVIIPLPLFHAAHRLRFTVKEFGLHAMDPAIAFLFYGGAFVMSGVTVYVVWFAV